MVPGMRADEPELVLGKLAAALQRAATPGERLRLFAQHLAEYPPEDQALLLHTVGARATEDPTAGQLLLLLLDVNALRVALGLDRFERLRRALATHPRGGPAERALRVLSSVEPGRVPLLRAKTAVLLQAASLLDDRLEAQRLGPLRPNGFELGERVVRESGLEDERVRVALDALPAAARPVAREVFLEADFEETEAGTFETAVSEEQLRVLGQAAGLGRVLGRGGGSASLPEAVAQRQALQLIRRFCLLCRSAAMYPPDHPSLPPAFEGFRDLVEQTIEGREQVTLTVLAGEVLLDDVKVRKEDRLKKTFVELCDERLVASLTFRPGLTVDEVRALVACFSESPRTVKAAGGARAFLARRGVTNILVDQFRYRLVTEGEEGAGEPGPGAAGDRLLESLVYGHVLERLERGGSLQGLPAEEVGAFFQDLLSRPDEERRRTLARLLVALDPEFVERGFLAHPELRQSLSWSAARRALEATFRDLDDEDPETRERALEAIGQFADLAIARQKETTVALISRRLGEYVGAEENDPDLLRKALGVFATVAAGYLRRRRLERGAAVVELLRTLARGEAVAPGGDGAVPPVALRPAVAGGVAAAARDALARLGAEEDVVDLLVQALADPDPTRSQLAAAVLEGLGTELVVVRLFRLFLDVDRAVRARAYRLLRGLGARAVPLLRREIEERQVPAHPGRDPATGVFQQEGEWYILRNCLDLLVELDPGGAGPLLAEAARDPDPRVRRESLRLLGRHGCPEAAAALRQGLEDPRPEVREAAVAGLGLVRDPEAVEALMDVVFRFPEHRRPALEALGHIGSARCVDFLLSALDAVETGGRRRRGRMRLLPDFPLEREAILQAIAAAGAIGGPEVESRLGQFLATWSSPLRRWRLAPRRRGLAPPDFVAAVENALALARRRRPRGAVPAGATPSGGRRPPWEPA